MVSKRRVLIVEDEYLIAVDLEEILKGHGLEQAEISGETEDALNRIRSEQWDAAILDGTLRGESSEPVAMELRERGIPFLVVTGYEPEKLPAGLRGVPVLQKPFQGELLMNALHGLWGEEVTRDT